MSVGVSHKRIKTSLKNDGIGVRNYVRHTDSVAARVENKKVEFLERDDNSRLMTSRCDNFSRW